MYANAQQSHGNNTLLGLLGIVVGLISLASYFGYLANIDIQQDILLLVSALFSALCGLFLLLQGMKQRAHGF